VGGVPEGIDAPPPAATGKLVEAVALSRPAPEFPAGALAAGERRTVVVEVEIGADGGVTGARTITPAATPLANAALAAARKTRFRPALRDGAPVPSTQLITYQFVNE
jgi:protein TonB